MVYADDEFRFEEAQVRNSAGAGDFQFPKISVVTPSYNQAEFVEEAIQSVVGQGYPNLEYIVMDGGSSDGSVAVIRKYTKAIDCWRSEPDDGQAAAINRGWRLATGDVLTWLNSDDRLEPEALFKVGETFGRDPAVRIVYGDCRVLDAGGEQLDVKSPQHYTPTTLLRGHSLPQPSVFMRRTLVEELGSLDASLEYALDWSFFLKAFLRTTAAERKYLPHVLSSSREYEGTKSRTGMNVKGEERRRVLEELRRCGELQTVSSSQYRAAVGGTYWIQAADEWLEGSELRAAISAGKAVIRQPSRLLKKLTSVPWFIVEKIRRARERDAKMLDRR